MVMKSSRDMALPVVEPAGSSENAKTILLKAKTRYDLRIILIGGMLFLIFFLVMAIVQFATPDMPDNDGFYHIRFAEIMRQQGFKPNFPWLPLSVLNAR